MPDQRLRTSFGTGQGQTHAGLTNAMVQLVLQQPAGKPGSGSAETYMPALTTAPGC
jgi:hypothetical protein